MNAPTPISDASDPRWIEMEAFLATQPGANTQAFIDMTPEQRAEAHDYFVRGIGDENRDGIRGDDDAILTFVALLRILQGSSPDPENDPTGDVALTGLYRRFEGREALLFEAAMTYIDFLSSKFNITGQQEPINEFLTAWNNR